VTRTVVLVEDHGLLAQTLASALSAEDVDVTVVDAPRSEDVLGEITAVGPDLVLLDLDLGPAGAGDDLIGPLTASGITVVVVTGVDDPVRLARCIRGGAVGVLDKGVSFIELLGAIERALSGESLLDNHQREERLAFLRAHERERARALAPFERLTQREAEVLAALMDGHSVSRIAEEAVVSVSTVRTQVRWILAKLEVGSQLEAIARARRAEWSPPA
jgi:DNA-binding NarL/FixJ family response regulator